LPVGRYKIPENAVPGTTKYGDLVHEQIGGLIKERLPDADLESGFKRFRANIARWKLAEPVLPLTYDYDGNIYYRFPK
jgi:hypothetical protein